MNSAAQNFMQLNTATAESQELIYGLFSTETDCAVQKEISRMVSALKLRHSVETAFGCTLCKVTDHEGVSSFFRLMFRHLLVRARTDSSIRISTEKNNKHYYIRIRYNDKYSFIYNQARIISKRIHDLIDTMNGALIVNELDGFEIRILIIIPLDEQ
jgi:hypothetical protein